MKYSIQYLWDGTMHYIQCDTRTTAEDVFDALTRAGYHPTMWQGATKVKG